MLVGWWGGVGGRELLGGVVLGVNRGGWWEGVVGGVVVLVGWWCGVGVLL